MLMVHHMGQSIQEWTKQNLWKTAFKKISLQIFQGCLPEILLGPFLNTLSHIFASGVTLHKSQKQL